MMSLMVEIDWRNFVDDLDDDVRRALVRSINRVADRARTSAAREVREQVNFPASYLRPSAGRLSVETRAKRDDLEAVISGRDRPTSLARFSPLAGKSADQIPRGTPVQVSVASGGQRKTIKRAFYMRLKNNNVGIAVRTSGGPPPGAWKPREMGRNLYLLYGPSVDQVLLSSKGDDGVYEDISLETLEMLDQEFGRQMDLLRSQKNA